MFRFLCQNGLVCGDVRVLHKGDGARHVIEGVYQVPDGFELAQEPRESMQAFTLDAGEPDVFARAALAAKYDAPDKPAPITESQILMRADVSTSTDRKISRFWLIGSVGLGRREEADFFKGNTLNPSPPAIPTTRWRR